MPTTVLVALIGAGSAILGATLVFLSKWLLEHPLQQRQVEVSTGSLLLQETTYLQGLIDPLRREVKEQAEQLRRSTQECDQQLAAVRAEAKDQIASVRAEAAGQIDVKDREIAMLETQAARLLLRVAKLEEGTSVPVP